MSGVPTAVEHEDKKKQAEEVQKKEIPPGSEAVSRGENGKKGEGKEGEKTGEGDGDKKAGPEASVKAGDGKQGSEGAGDSLSPVKDQKSAALPNPLAGGDDGPVRLLVPDKKFKKQGDLIRLSYDDIDLIKVLNLKVPQPDVMDLLPEWLKKLDGQKVQLRGFMYPAFQQEGLDRFVFCRDTGACCFGPNPVIYYLVNVRLKDGSTTHYIENRPFDVVGTFHIRPGIISSTGLVYEMYHLEDAVVKEK